MSDELIFLNKLSYQSDRRSLVEQTGRAQTKITILENDLKTAKELLTVCQEAFEEIIGPLGAGIVINPNSEMEDLAQRFYRAMAKFEKLQ